MRQNRRAFARFCRDHCRTLPAGDPLGVALEIPEHRRDRAQRMAWLLLRAARLTRVEAEKRIRQLGFTGGDAMRWLGRPKSPTGT